MNILISLPVCSPTIDGFYNVLTQLNNHTIFTWEYGQESIYKICDQQKIDLFFCHYTHITHSALEAIAEYKIPTVTFGPVNNFPELKFSCEITPAANLIPAPEHPSFDILYLCDNNHSLLSKHIQQMNNNNIQFKLLGQNKLPYVEYIGKINIIERLSLCKAAKIVILDNLNYIYDIAINKGFALVSQPNEIYPMFSEELIEQIKHFLTDDKHRISISKKAYKEAKNNTYYHRAANIFTNLDLPKVAQECLQQLSKVLDS